MRKLLALGLICFFISPAVAQPRGHGRARSTKTPHTYHLRKKVAKQSHRRRHTSVVDKLEKNGRGTPLIHIMDLEHPLIRLNIPMPDNSSLLMARLLGEQEIIPIVFPEGLFAGKLFIPPALNTQERVGFRGLVLNDIYELENILTNGLEAWRSSSGHVFFSGSPRTAAMFAKVPREKFSVILSFYVPEDVPIFEYNANYYVKQDISAAYLKEVMIFLEVDGKPGWYKATLEDGEIIFTPTPGQIFEANELYEHTFEVPTFRIDWW